MDGLEPLKLQGLKAASIRHHLSDLKVGPPERRSRIRRKNARHHQKAAHECAQANCM